MAISRQAVLIGGLSEHRPLSFGVAARKVLLLTRELWQIAALTDFSKRAILTQLGRARAMLLGPVMPARTAFCVIAIAILAILASAPPARAQNVGTITRLEGTAQIQRAGRTTPAALTMAIELHDRITTGPNSWLTVSMVGGSSLTLSATSTMVINESALYGGTAAPSKVGLLSGT